MHTPDTGLPELSYNDNTPDVRRLADPLERPMRPDPFDTTRSSSSGDREPYAYERERLITERERLRQILDR